MLDPVALFNEYLWTPSDSVRAALADCLAEQPLPLAVAAGYTPRRIAITAAELPDGIRVVVKIYPDLFTEEFQLPAWEAGGILELLTHSGIIATGKPREPG